MQPILRLWTQNIFESETPPPRRGVGLRNAKYFVLVDVLFMVRTPGGSAVVHIGGRLYCLITVATEVATVIRVSAESRL